MSGEERSEEFQGNKDAVFSVKVEGADLFLKIIPARGDGKPVSEDAIAVEIEKLGVIEYDHKIIKNEIANPSQNQIKIATIEKSEIHIEISKDRMEAFLQVELGKNALPVTWEEISEKIKASGIVFGIDEAEARKAMSHPGNRMVIARGLPPVNGIDAKIKYHFELENKGKPVELDDGKVDYKDLNLFTIVAQGDTLAERIPSVPGVEGSDVFGQPIVAKPGKEIPLPLGKNVQAVDNLIVAAIAGQVVVVSNKISVVPVIEIKEDVDLSTGNIEFVGNVVVRGSVQPGFTVKAEGNVEIYGTVSGGIVEGKNILIKMGIQGMHRGYVKAAENLVAKFIENATAQAGNDIIVNEVVLHSRLSAGKKVIVEGRRGLIAGGNVMAGEEIRAKLIGTQMATSTELEVGVNPQLREEYQNIKREIKKVEISLEQTQKALSILRAMDQSSMPQDKREMLLKLTKAQFHLVGQVETMRNRMTDIELAFEEMKYGRIKAAEVIYPGVKLVIGTLVKPIREPMKFVSLYAEDGEIRIGTYK